MTHTTTLGPMPKPEFPESMGHNEIPEYLDVDHIIQRQRDEVKATRIIDMPMAERKDEELILAYRDSNDTQAYEELYRRFEREIYSYLRRFLNNATAAEDVMQDTFLQLHMSADTYDGTRKVRPWLYTIATNKAIDFQRRGKRHQMVSLDRRDADTDDDAGTIKDLLEAITPAADAGLQSMEKKDWLIGAIAQLPDEYSKPLELIYYGDLKYREVADIMSIPVGTVKSRVHTAMQKLQEMPGADRVKADLRVA